MEPFNEVELDSISNKEQDISEYLDSVREYRDTLWRAKRIGKALNAPEDSQDLKFQVSKVLDNMGPNDLFLVAQLCKTLLEEKAAKTKVVVDSFELVNIRISGADMQMVVDRVQKESKSRFTSEPPRPEMTESSGKQ